MPQPQPCISLQMLAWFFLLMSCLIQIFGWHWSNIEHYSMCIKYQPIWSLPQGSKWVSNSLLRIHHKNCPVSRLTFYFQFFASSCCWSHSGHWFLEKVQNYCCSRDQLKCLLVWRPNPPPNSLCIVFRSMQLGATPPRGKNRWTHLRLTVRVTSP